MHRDPKAELGEKIRELRVAADLTLRDVRRKLHERGLVKGTSIQHLSQIELGTSWSSPELVVELDSVLDASGEVIHLFRKAKLSAAKSQRDDCFSVTAHLFYPLLVDRVPTSTEAYEPGDLDFVPRLGLVRGSESNAVLHSFPFQVVVLHEAHALEERNLADIATWRETQIERCPTAAAEELARLKLKSRSLDGDPYCFTAFVLRGTPWQDERLRSRATEILAMPTVLLTDLREQSLEDREAALLYSTTPIGDVIDFSVTGSYFGFASWAAVSMLPSLSGASIESLLIEFELQLQAVWCYAFNVGASGVIKSRAYDHQFLREVLHQLQRPAPREHTGVRRLREALLQTSRIADVVNSSTPGTKVSKGGKT